MSRCFPFPPPGYEIKARPDDLNLAITKKDKHKKHKDKNKKKKERSVSYEKERSEAKHKEEKDRKHKKHKERKDKKKDKRRSSEEKKIVAGSLENYSNGEKLVLENRPINGVRDYEVLIELGKRISNDGDATDNQTVHKITPTEQRNPNNGSVLVESYGDISSSREHRSLADGERLNFSGENQIDCKKENENNVGKGDGYKNEDGDKNSKAEKKKRKKEKKKEKSKDKIKEIAKHGSVIDNHSNNNAMNLIKEIRDGQEKLQKHKLPVSNGFLHDNGIQPNNMSRPALPSFQVSQNGSGFRTSQDNAKLAVDEGAVFTNQRINGKMLTSPSESVIKKARNIEPGVGTTIDNHFVRNGLKKEPCKLTYVVKMEKIINNHKVDEKTPTPHRLVENGRKNQELKSNGVCEVKLDNSLRPPSASVKVEEKKVVKPPPHPDLRYLTQILTVPTVEEWPQFDDQEWLFGCKDWDSQPKKPKLASSQIEWTKPVWAEAVQLESANVTAMPYVIPY